MNCPHCGKPIELTMITATDVIASLSEEERTKAAAALFKAYSQRLIDEMPRFTEAAAARTEQEITVVREDLYGTIRSLNGAEEPIEDIKALQLMCVWLVMHAEKKLLAGFHYWMEKKDDDGSN